MKNELAIKKYEQVVKNEPNNLDAFFQLGKLYEEAGNLNAAIHYLEKSLSMDSTFTNARYQLGIVFSQNAAYEHAVKEWRKIVDGDGDFRYNEIDLTCIVNIAAAVKSWEMYDTQEPETPYKHFTLGFVYYCLRQIDKAIEHFQVALELKPGDPVTLRNLANAYRLKGVPDKAQEYLQRAKGIEKRKP